MTERKFKFAGIELTTTNNTVNYVSLLDELYLLRQDDSLSSQEKKEKLQAIIRGVTDEQQ